MSTNINITVGDNALLDAAKAAQTASRQSQLEKEAAERLATEATDARTEANASAGKDANGNPLYGTRLQKPQVERRPAANRAGDEFLLLRPDSPAVDNTFATRSRGFPKFLTVANLGADYAFEATGGPTPAAPAISVLSFANDGLALNGEFPFAGSTRKYKNGVQDFTAEMFFKYDDYDHTTLVQRAVVFRVGTGFIVNGEGYCAFSCTFVTGAQQFNLFGKAMIGATVRESASNEEIVLYDEEFWLQGSVNPGLPTGSPIVPGSWHHVAICKNGPSIRFFIDGVLLSSTVVDWDTMVFGSTPISDFFNIFTEGDGSTRNRIHGFRFTPKALYTAPFTPPTNF